MSAAPGELEDLIAQFGGRVEFPPPPADRPYVFANFISTLDGVVSFALPGRAGGGDISGGEPADRFLMGLLRASADAVVVGAGTLREVPARGTWRPSATYPSAGEYFASLQPRPLLFVVVTGSGRLDLDRAVFRTPALPALVLTGEDGARRLELAGAAALPAVAVRAVPAGQHGLDVAAMLDLLVREFGVRHLLHEGGPTLIGDFLRAGALDELFLTLAPRLAGRAANQPRPGLVEGLALPPEAAPWLRLASARSRGDFLYLRYRR